MIPQRTLARPVTLYGRGLHTGFPVRLCVRPAPENTGLVFVRLDRDPPHQVPADWRNVFDTQRATTLRCGTALVRTVEHCLSAVFAVGLTNARIELDAEELPIMDGSARPFVDALRHGGLVEQGAPVIERALADAEIRDDEGNMRMLIRPDNVLRLTYHLDLGFVRESLSVILSPEDFAHRIAPARTFCTCAELDFLARSGLMGGALSDSGFLVAGPGEPLEPAFDHFGLRADRKFIHERPNHRILSAEPPRFDDEMVRHKILDLIGDLALYGCRLRGVIEAFGTGHSDNLRLLRRLEQVSN